MKHYFATPVHRPMGRSHDITYACAACGMRADWDGARDPCQYSRPPATAARKPRRIVHRRSGQATVCGRMIAGALTTTTKPETVTCRWCIAMASQRAQQRAEAAE